MEAGAWTFLASYSVAVDFDDRVCEGLRCFLGKVVPNPTADHAVAVLARELLGVRVSHVADELKGRDRNTERIRRVVDAQPECGLEDLPLRLGLLRQSSDDRAQELVQARKSYLGF